MAHVIWGQEEGQAEAASHCLCLISSYTACPTIFAELFSFVIRYSPFLFSASSKVAGRSDDLQIDFNVELEFANNSGVHDFHETTAPS